MDIEVYFSDLKKKYGVTEALSNLIDKQKEEYLKFYKDMYDDSDGPSRILRSIESRIKMEYEIHMIHEDPEFKPLFELVREHMMNVKGETRDKTDGTRHILEDPTKAFRDFKKQVDT